MEILVSHPEALLLAREASGELPETALVVPEMPLARVVYYRCIVLDGDLHEHAVVLNAAGFDDALRARVADLLSRRKPTRVAYADSVAPGRYALVGDSVGPRELGVVAAAARAAGFDAPSVDVTAAGRTFRVSAVLDKRVWRCLCSSVEQSSAEPSSP